MSCTWNATEDQFSSWKNVRIAFIQSSNALQHVADPKLSLPSMHAHALPVRDASWQNSSPLSESGAVSPKPFSNLIIVEHVDCFNIDALTPLMNRVFSINR